MTIEDLVTTSQSHVHILYQAYLWAMPLSGATTVDDARAWLEERHNLDPRVSAVLDGEEVAGHTAVCEGQYLCFVRKSGEMGG